ncbi:ribonuclease H-like domain-containing protein [Pilobolus umbonatus]|nr:ribonuclease H-like domain-containing protein [Pilobolus umbonatus]
MSTPVTKDKKKNKKIVPSQNWKKLLAELPIKKDTTKKRKTDDFELSPNYKGFNKKQKIENAKAAKLALKEKKKEKTTDIPKTEELWFADDVDKEVIEKAYAPKETAKDLKQKKKAILAEMNSVSGKAAEVGKYVAIDCEMVGVGPDGTDSALARVSLVNYNGAVLLDTYVKPMEKVTDYRTHVSGIEPHHLQGDNAITLREAQEKTEAIIRNRILIGHAVHNDLQALMLSHPSTLIRDTSRYKPFRQLSKGRTPGLRMLVKEILGITIQSGSHSSVEDARFTIQLYKHVKNEWEKKSGSRSKIMLDKMST